MENPYILVSELLEEINNRRIQDVIRRRFGLVNGQPQTLQEIGDDYNITRERVRQIEKNGLDFLLQPEIKARLKPAFAELNDYFKQYGELRRETKALDDLVYYCVPANFSLTREPLSGAAAKAEELLKEKNKELNLCRSALNLLLTLGEPFSRMAETNDFYPMWTINKNSFVKAKKTVDSAVKYFGKNRQVLKNGEIYNIIKKAMPGVSEKAVHSYIDASKLIEQNHFGEFGLADWPEISPRGVRDKAYLILKKEAKPFHFTEVTNLINETLPQSRPAYVQTVHNELIKDPRFVLIGRGIYALAEWGYQPGTVIEVIRQILKENGPQTKDEIIEKVMAKRLIKENTILINLQNKKYFKKLADGRYGI